MKTTNTLEQVSNDELLRRLSSLLRDSRRVEADLIAHIGEVDRRRLYADEATPSMFAYCIERLHLSEGEAFLRIQVARAARQHPVLLEMLADGRLHLTGIGKLVPHVTIDNREEVLKRATHKSKREIEELVAELHPRPDVPASVRKLRTPAVAPPHPGEVAAPDPAPGQVCRNVARPDEVGRLLLASPTPQAQVKPLAPERFKVQFTASAELREKLQRLQALMPRTDLASIIEQTVTEKLERLEAKRFAKTKRPRKSLAGTRASGSSRYMPAAVRRVVHERDHGRCTYVDERNRRCTARRHLEFHHVDPYSRGGGRDPSNIKLMCWAHNALLADRDYGKAWMNRFRGGARAGQA